jgi:hypothetical protein
MKAKIPIAIVSLELLGLYFSSLIDKIAQDATAIVISVRKSKFFPVINGKNKDEETSKEIVGTRNKDV